MKLAHALCNTKRGITASQFAERQHVDRRAVYRDIKALKTAGYPIINDNTRYRLIEGWYPLAQTGVVIQRISTLPLRDTTFSPRPEASSQHPLRGAYRTWASDDIETVELQFAPNITRENREHTWQTQTDTNDGGVILRMNIAAPLEIESWLTGFGPDVTVRDRLQNKLSLSDENQSSEVKKREAHLVGQISDDEIGRLGAAR